MDKLKTLAPEDYLMHYGIEGQKWGKRRYQNPDGSLTPEGRQHYGYKMHKNTSKLDKYENNRDSYNVTYSMSTRPFRKLSKDFDKQNKNLIDTWKDKDTRYEKIHKEANKYANKEIQEKFKNMSLEERIGHIHDQIVIGKKAYDKYMKDSGWKDKDINELKNIEKTLERNARKYVDEIDNEFADISLNHIVTGTSVNLKTGEYKKSTPKEYLNTLLYGRYLKYNR